MRIGISIAIVIILAVLSPCLADWGYDNLANWDKLPQLKTNVAAGLASSYDRAGGNADYSQYEYPTGLQKSEITCTVKTLTGSGVITRFWMPHLTAKKQFAVRMYFDGETAPRIDTDSKTILSGNYSYMNGPLVTTASGGQVLYEPIPFAHSLKIETVNKVLPDSGFSSNRHYYQYGYHLFSVGGPSQSYTGTLTSSEQAQRNKVNSMLNNLGSNPAGSASGATTLANTGLSVSGHSAVNLASINGSGAIRKLAIKMDSASDSELENLRLRIKYDNDTNYAIDVPVAHFFGAGYGRAAYKSLPMGTNSDDGFYCYLPMPYRKGISVELYNSSDNPISIDSTKTEYLERAVNSTEAYLHTALSTEVTTAGQQYHQILSVEGKGHYIGNLLWVEKPSGGSFSVLEGDDIITADGQVLAGTGMEDAYNSGYYYNWVGIQSDEPEGARPTSAIRAYSGLLNLDADYDPDSHSTTFYRSDQYRWHIPDYIPFDNNLDVSIENYGGAGNVAFGSTAFYYLLPEPSSLLLLFFGLLVSNKTKRYR